MKYITDSAVAELTGERVDDYDVKQEIKSKWTVIEDDHLGVAFSNAQIVYRNDGTAQLIGERDMNHNCTPTYLQISSALALYRTISLFECGIRTSGCDYYKVNWQVVLKHVPKGKVPTDKQKGNEEESEDDDQEKDSEESNEEESEENDQEEKESEEEGEDDDPANYLILSEWKGAFMVQLTGPNMDNEFEKTNTMRSIEFETNTMRSIEYRMDVVRLMTLLATPQMTIGYDGTVAGEIA